MAYSLFLHGSAVREIAISYGPADAWKEIVVDENLAGMSLISYELPIFLANSRHYLDSRPPGFNGIIQQYGCTGVTKVTDALSRRSSDVAFGQLLEDLEDFHPCGLVSMSIFTDQFRLTHTEGGIVEVDETDLALPSDSDLYEPWIVPVLETNGNSTVEKFQVEGVRSWIPDRTFLEHLKVWYRTPVAPYVRHLWARIPGGLVAGRYNLTFPVNSPIWTEMWGLEAKRVIFSQKSLSHMGSPGASFTLAALCCIVAFVEFVVALALLVGGKASGQRRAAIHPD
eukprot:CAMPEP_0181446362 /NCGR_PEP_ID=MMETSP1110-20121109/26064_1 /TAXON_ID=174948 /ORGANISM="Symbiodinium sp., Strain CCMP421" /LENGTH=282 /DNA_ID=CAMNT_0023570435 /DNA_START=256 /DNA_END=1104 /DNA_ORIENTATION=+